MATSAENCAFPTRQENDPTPAIAALEDKLKTLELELEEQRVKQKIPGMALAIVHDDKVIFAKGFGFSDLASKQQVGTETLFPIASTTKPITTSLIAMLVDEGLMHWDDPVTKYIPDFHLNIETGDNEVTIRDLLCHRTGYSRMGLLYAGSLTREEVILHAMKAQPRAGFREKFNYNNVMFTVAGVCAGKADDGSWDSLLEARVFNRLGMNASSTTKEAVANNPRLSTGYVWDEDRKQFEPLPLVNLNAIGPAGSVNSSVSDMARWLRMQLNRGKVGDRTLVSELQLAEMWKPQISVQDGVDYGLGWMRHDWNGLSVLHHGGNVGGFSSQVAIMPEMNTGFVLLTNASISSLQNNSIDIIFSSLHGHLKETKTPAIGSPIVAKPDEANLEAQQTDSQIAGKYHDREFGTEIVVTFEKDEMQATMGEYTYKFSPPANGKRWTSTPDPERFQIEFKAGKDGNPESLMFFQPGPDVEFFRDDESSKLPSTDVLINKIKVAHGTFDDNVAGINLNGTANYIHQGAIGKTEITISREGRHITTTDFGKMGMMSVSFNADKGVRFLRGIKYERLTGKRLKRTRYIYPALFVDAWKQQCERVWLADQDQINGEQVFLLVLQISNTDKQKLFVSQKSGLILKIESETVESGIPMTTSTTYSDYRSVGGFQFPFRSVSENEYVGKTITTLVSGEPLRNLPANTFSILQTFKSEK